MNAKQRKQAQKALNQALLDSGNSIAVEEISRLNYKLARMREEIELREEVVDQRSRSLDVREKMLSAHREDLEARSAKDKEDLDAWVRQKGEQVTQNLRDSEIMRARAAEQFHELTEKAANFKDGVILKDVLLQLELDIPPMEIADNLRREHGLLIAQW